MNLSRKHLRFVQVILIFIVLRLSLLPAKYLPRFMQFTWTRWLIVVLAVYSGIAGVFFQRRFAGRSSLSAQSRWSVRQVVYLGCSLSVAMYGFLLRIAGGPFWVAVALYAAGLILLVIWSPGTVPTDSRNHPQIGMS